MEYDQARKLIRQAYAELITHCNPGRALILLEEAHDLVRLPELDAAIDTFRHLSTGNLNTIRRARARIRIAHNAIADLAVAAGQVEELALNKLIPLELT